MKERAPPGRSEASLKAITLFRPEFVSFYRFAVAVLN
jgi:hypothetical protein